MPRKTAVNAREVGPANTMDLAPALHSFQFGKVLVHHVFSYLLSHKECRFPYYYRDGKSLVLNRGGDWKALLSRFSLESEGLKIKTNVPLSTYSKDEQSQMTFDGMHRVDVALVNEILNIVVPFEVKLGVTGGAKTFPNSFTSEWLGTFSHSKGASKIVGSMMSILDEAQADIEVKVWPDEGTRSPVLSKAWGLVVRRQSVGRPSIRGMTRLPDPIVQMGGFQRLEVLLVFEDLWAALGDARKDITKLLVSELELELGRLSKDADEQS